MKLPVIVPIDSGKITENDTLNTGDGRYSNIGKITDIGIPTITGI